MSNEEIDHVEDVRISLAVLNERVEEMARRLRSLNADINSTSSSLEDSRSRIRDLQVSIDRIVEHSSDAWERLEERHKKYDAIAVAYDRLTALGWFIGMVSAALITVKGLGIWDWFASLKLWK